MAFSHYSNLFTSGLLSDTCPPSSRNYTAHPWATDSLGPRRGSLPGTVNSIVPIPSPPPTARMDGDSMAASGESFYFTFKKRQRRNPVDYRSFLSLDLAESQSLRSASLKGRDGKSEASSSRLRFHRSPASCITSPARSSFSGAVQSPPPSARPPPQSSSPPRLSRLHVPTPVRPTARHPLPPVPSVSSPSSSSGSSAPRLPPVQISSFKFPAKTPLLSPTFLHSPSTTQVTSPISPVSKGGLSPMRFASPPPSPVIDTDSIGPKSYTTSSVSSTFRKAQRVDALARLEGREMRAGRRSRNPFPRVSQNFMSMSDDDDDEAFDEQIELEAVPEVHIEDSERPVLDLDLDFRPLNNEDRFEDAQGLVVSIDAAALALFNLTPRTSAHAFSWSQFLDSPEPKPKAASRATVLADVIPRSKSALSHSHHAENSHFVSKVDTLSKKRHRTSHPPRLSLNLESGWAPVEVNFIDLQDEQQDDAVSGSDSWRSIFEVSCSA